MSIMTEMRAPQHGPTTSGLPLVAVVTPVYNGGIHFAKTLACVQNQTYPNIVHVVLDNASSDDTAATIAAHMDGPKRILTRRNDRLLPQIENWNAAMRMVPSDARYVKFLTADDLMRKDCIQRMVALAESDSEINFVHSIDVFNGQTKPHGLDPSLQVYDGLEYGRRWMLGQVTWLSGSHVFFRASPGLLENTFSTAIFPLMDMEFIFRCLLNRKIGFLFEPLIYTRFDEATVTAKLGGFSSYIMPSYRILLKHGLNFLNEKEFASACKSYHRKVARHYLFARMAGLPNSAGIEKGLALEGMRLGLLTYLDAVTTWPVHKLNSLLARSKRHREDPSIAVSEEGFLPERA